MALRIAEKRDSWNFYQCQLVNSNVIVKTLIEFDIWHYAINIIFVMFTIKITKKYKLKIKQTLIRIEI